MDTADPVKGGLHSSFHEILVLDSLRQFAARFAVNLVLNTLPLRRTGPKHSNISVSTDSANGF